MLTPRWSLSDRCCVCTYRGGTSSTWYVLSWYGVPPGDTGTSEGGSEPCHLDGLLLMTACRDRAGRAGRNGRDAPRRGGGGLIAYQ